ncbi:uncharacterized protein LOC117651224 [Thrips palmi]|uniref:Uncharacterized protein LOC117651224 n=1 Tax=Thrips palmi TaxID=161013 RepID=A0A6P9A0H4_THRPL|nr:uncharacterized protein LOC117651224 [Thrips palmi]
MECPVCMDEFDVAARRPKSLPCGHTVCSHCLEGLQQRLCPKCRKGFSDPAKLPDNFSILDWANKQQSRPSQPSDSSGSTPSFDRALQQLEDAATAASKAVRTLEDAKDAVEGLLQEWRARLRQVQKATGELRAAVDEGGDLEAGQPEGLQQLQDAASLLEGMECALRHQGGTEWRGDLGAGRSLLDALVLHLHRHGLIHKTPAQNQPEEEARPPPRPQDLIQEIELFKISQAHPGKGEVEKAAILARVRQNGVRRMDNVWCHADLAWVRDILGSATPTLEELYMIAPRADAMPRLRRMDLWSIDGALDNEPPLVPALPGGGLRRLRVYKLPRATLISLLQAHSASLEVLWMSIGTPGDGQWPRVCDDLDALLRECGLRVYRIVLWRVDVDHSESACRAQVSAVRRVLPGAKVQCEKCDEVELEKF